MDTIRELRRYVLRVVSPSSHDSNVRSADRSGASAGGEAITTAKWGPETEVDPVGFDPENLTNRADVVTELGLRPEAFLVQLVEEQGGRLPQQALRDYTSWSEALISRVLQDMEGDGEITRVQRGRKKIVCLPGHAPASRVDSSAGRDDPPIT